MDSDSDSSAHYPGGVIDLRLFRPRERLGIVEQTLRVLRPGETVLLVFHEPPERLTAHLQTHFAPAFRITPVAQGPDIWSLRVDPPDACAAD